MTTERIFSELELLYAATGRCRCGAGLAHPLDHAQALKLRSWACSAVLKGEVHEGSTGTHDIFDFATWKVREETSINNADGWSTRPAGTRALTVGKAKCPKCQHAWQSEPYSACGASHHWISGACPGCGYAVGSGTSWSTRDGEPIEKRCVDVVLQELHEPTSEQT